jgi:hypothetical protein
MPFFPSGGGSGSGGLSAVARQVLGAPGNFTFSGLTPANGLMLLGYVRSSNASPQDNAFLRFNNDVAADYTYQEVRGAAALATAQATSAAGIATICAAATANPGFSTFQVWIPVANGTQNGNTPCHGQTAYMVAGDSRAVAWAGLWTGTALITRVDVIAAGPPNTFLAGSTMELFTV